MAARAETAVRRGSLARAPGLPLALALLVGLAVFPQLAPIYFVNVVSEALIFGLFATSLDLLVGYTGLVSFGHGAFLAMGAYTAGILAIRAGPSLLATYPAGVLGAGLLALVIGALSIRSGGVYFLMLTMAFSQMVFAAAFKWTWLTGGSNGLAGVPRPTLGLTQGSEFGSPQAFYYLVLVLFLASLVLLLRVVRSPFGSVLVGIRENESRMLAIGYNTWRYKLGAFTIAGLFGGLTGCLLASYNGFVSPNDALWTTSGLAIVMVIIGGTGTLWGPVLGSAFVLILQNVVSSRTDFWAWIMGVVFILFVLFARRGIAGLLAELGGLGGRRAWRS